MTSAHRSVSAAPDRLPESVRSLLAKAYLVVQAAAGPKGENRGLPELQQALLQLRECPATHESPAWPAVLDSLLVVVELGQHYAVHARRKARKLFKSVETVWPEWTQALTAVLLDEPTAAIAAWRSVAASLAAEHNPHLLDEGRAPIPVPDLALMAGQNGPPALVETLDAVAEALPEAAPALPSDEPEAVSALREVPVSLADDVTLPESLPSEEPPILLRNDEVRAHYINDAERLLPVLEANLAILADEPTVVEARMAQREALHNLRGASAMAGAAPLAHLLEDLHRLLEVGDNFKHGEPAQALEIFGLAHRSVPVLRDILGLCLAGDFATAGLRRDEVRREILARWGDYFYEQPAMGEDALTPSDERVHELLSAVEARERAAQAATAAALPGADDLAPLPDVAPALPDLPPELPEINSALPEAVALPADSLLSEAATELPEAAALPVDSFLSDVASDWPESTPLSEAAALPADIIVPEAVGDLPEAAALPELTNDLPGATDDFGDRLAPALPEAGEELSASGLPESMALPEAALPEFDVSAAAPLPEAMEALSGELPAALDEPPLAEPMAPVDATAEVPALPDLPELAVASATDVAAQLPDAFLDLPAALPDEVPALPEMVAEASAAAPDLAALEAVPELPSAEESLSPSAAPTLAEAAPMAATELLPPLPAPADAIALPTLAAEPTEVAPAAAPAAEATPSSDPKVHGSSEPVLISFDDLDPREEVDPELIVYFVQEYQENFQMIATALQSLRRNARDRDSWKTIHRLVHGTKGAANAMGLFRAGRLMSGLEEFVEAILDGFAHPSLEQFSALLQDAENTIVILEEEARGLRSRSDQLARLNTLGQRIFAIWQSSAAAPSASPATPAVSTAPSAEAPTPAPLAAAEAPVAEETEAVDPELLHFFIQEFRENDEQIGQALFAWESNPSNDEAQRTIYRLVHSTKGAANSMGLRRIGRLLHSLEDLLQEQRDAVIMPAVKDVVTVCFGCLDLTRSFVREAEGEASDPTSGDRLITLLAEIQRIRTTAPKPAAAPAPGPTDMAAPAPSSPAIPSVQAPTEAPSPAEELPAETEAAASTATGEQSIRIATERLDFLMNLIGELVINRTRLEKKIADVVRLKEDLSVARTRLNRLIADFKDKFEFSTTAGTARSGFERMEGDAPRGTTADEAANASLGAGFSELELDRYDDFNILSRSLVEIGSDTDEIISQLDRFFGSFADDTSAFSKITTSLQDSITRIRMVPLRPLFLLLQRGVRDAATKEGKDVEFVAEGTEVRLDKIITDQCYAPLMHIVRNAVSHGIQSAEKRQARGKSEKGRITVRATQESNLVSIEIADDGEGLNFDAIRRKALRMGLVASDAVLDRETLADVIFQPGFSTTDVTTEVSGRGVGLDAALRDISRLGGNINVISRDGLGTTFVVKVPLTLSINQAMVLRLGTEVFALPLNFVERVYEFSEDRVQVHGTQEVMHLEDRNVPLIRLRQLLDLPPEANSPKGIVVVAQVGDLRLALHADKILRRQDIVVKNLGALLDQHPLFSGATMAGDGQIILILDLPAIFQLFRGHGQSVAKRLEAAPARLVPSAPRARPAAATGVSILCVDDSLSIRNICMRYVSALGYKVESAVDGLDALEKIRLGNYALILTDLEMPRLNGFELLAELRRQDRTRDIPIVVITSRDANKHRAHAQELGANDYIIKPFNQEQLGSCIRRLLAEQPASAGR